MNTVRSRFWGYAAVLVVYILAFVGFWLVHTVTYQGNLLLSTFWGDIAATIVVWLFGLLFKNSSFYDPYWSVAPLAILPFWLVLRQASLGFVDILFLLAIFIWGIRLTLNWAVRWRGLKHQDWRYTMLKKQSPRWWILINLAGIHLMPTILVFGGMIPVYVALFHGTWRNNLLLALGLVACLGAVAIQLTADRQMDAFKKRQPEGTYIDEGVWQYSRHPNYFGEILFWWGLWLMQIGVSPGLWFTVAGPVLMTLLFVFISIPMMEKHILETKPEYSQYQQSVSVILPWFRKEATYTEKSA